MNLLVATAPWPILVRIVSTRPGPWAVWGAVPAAVLDFLASEGHRVLASPLPRPMHRYPLPDEVTSTTWQTVVVPALGHPLPTRWPIVRRLAELGAPVIVSDGASWQWVHLNDIPAEDAYTWALDRLCEPAAAPPASPDVDLMCVRADFLSDLLLAWPAIGAAARRRRTTLVTSDRLAPWARAVADGSLDIRALPVDEWAGGPVLPSAADVLDVSKPGSTSPLTPALAHAASAVRRLRVADRRTSLTMGEMVAEALDVRLPTSGHELKRTESRTGLLCPSGSSAERDLEPATWATLAKIAGAALGVDRWTIVGVPRDRAQALAQTIPNASIAPFPAQPIEVVALMDSAHAVLSVSSALAHLAAIRHVPTIVVEHPSKAPFVNQVPGAHVHYVRPSSPWWRAQPDAIDIARATVGRGDSYGFWPEELTAGVEDAAKRLASAPSFVGIER